MKRLLVIVVLVAAIVCARRSAAFLVVNNAEHSDVLLVLAGDHNDQRFWHGIDRLRRGYAQQMVLDARSDHFNYGHSDYEEAVRFVAESVPDVRARIHVCAFAASSTRTEVRGAKACLDALHPRSAIVVTSDYHTQRALSICRTLVPQYRWTASAVPDPSEFGTAWWKHLDWTKTNAQEWQRLLWWELVERWR